MDALRFLWPAIEAVQPIFTRAAVIRWPAGVRDQLVAANLLVPQDHTTHIRCPECGQLHISKPVAREQADGSTRFFIPCPENLRAEVKDRDLEQWAANVEGLVNSIWKSLALGGQPARLDSDRIWRCGRWNDKDVLRDMLFARGLRRSDAAQFRRTINRAQKPIVFVASEIPDPDFWHGRVPPLVRLREIATFTSEQFLIDVAQVIGLVRAADEIENASNVRGRKEKQATIRRAVKEEIKSLVSDDALVAAYKKFGSYDKAVAGLAKEGVETNRWAVERAVKRAGGVKAVARIDDSESVVRSRSSRRRDTPIEKRN